MFNSSPSYVMHIDLNSCFASVEQQANPLLRGKPVAVAAYTTSRGCILAASTEAKRFGVKVGLRVGEGRLVCPGLIVLPPDPDKYRYVNRKLFALFKSYTEKAEMKSIDEAVLDFRWSIPMRDIAKIEVSSRMRESAIEIKRRIKADIGDWLTVSVGIAPNRFLAKTASSLHKPDGLSEICKNNIEQVLKDLELEDLCGIDRGFGKRLRLYGILTPVHMYHAPVSLLCQAFSSILGKWWWMRLHGWEIDDRQFPRRSFGQSYALYRPYKPDDARLHQILCQLVDKMSRRLRMSRCTASGVHVGCLYSDWRYWHKSRMACRPLYGNQRIYAVAKSVLIEAPKKFVRIISVSCYGLTSDSFLQLHLFEDEFKIWRLSEAIDRIQDRWGNGVVASARTLCSEQKIKDRIAFGSLSS